MDEEKKSTQNNQEIIDMSNQPLFSDYFMQSNDGPKESQTVPFPNTPEVTSGKVVEPVREDHSSFISPTGTSAKAPTPPFGNAQNGIQPTTQNQEVSQNQESNNMAQPVMPQPLPQQVTEQKTEPQPLPQMTQTPMPGPVPMDYIPPVKPKADLSDQPSVGKGILLMICIVIGVIGIITLNKIGSKIQYDLDAAENNIPLDSSTPTETKEEKENPVTEEKKEEVKEPEVTNTLNCKGTMNQDGVSVQADIVIVFKNKNLYTYHASMKSDSLTPDLAKELGRQFAYSGYSYDYDDTTKTITASGSLNTLRTAVLEQLGTIDKAQEYYKSINLSCNLT